MPNSDTPQPGSTAGDPMAAQTNRSEPPIVRSRAASNCPPTQLKQVQDLEPGPPPPPPAEPPVVRMPAADDATETERIDAPDLPNNLDDITADVAPSPVVASPATSTLTAATVQSAAQKRPRSALKRIAGFPFRLAGVLWRVASLFVLLAVAAAIPIVQFASLGYLLHSAARLASGRPWRECLPGTQIAGRIAGMTACAALCWLPVWLVTDLSYSAQILQPGATSALLWRLAALLVSAVWLTHIAWAAARGGRWWHFVWPAPIGFLKRAWRVATWRRLSDDLYETLAALQLPQLWWLGLRAAVGAIVWTCVPVSMMIIGLRAEGSGGVALVGLIGAIGMILVMLYLPFLQIQMARSNRFRDLFGIRRVRRRFLAAPWAHTMSLLALCLLSIPLYLLRIEAPPAELQWAPCLVFVIFMLPAKWLLGAAMGYAERRETSAVAEGRSANRSWFVRWPARVVGMVSVLIYVGALYFAQLVAGQGAFVMYFQHAFLVPAPLLGS